MHSCDAGENGGRGDGAAGVVCYGGGEDLDAGVEGYEVGEDECVAGAVDCDGSCGCEGGGGEEEEERFERDHFCGGMWWGRFKIRGRFKSVLLAAGELLEEMKETRE